VNFGEFSSVLKNSSMPPWSPDQGLKDPLPQCFGLGLVVLDSLLICRPARERPFQQAVSFYEVGCIRILPEGCGKRLHPAYPTNLASRVISTPRSTFRLMPPPRADWYGS
jgi:hypothetical protein